MRQSGHIVRQVLDHVRSMVAPGVTTMDLERAAEKKIGELGAKPAFKGYYDYPCVLCTSVNEEIVHGIRRKNGSLKQAILFRSMRSGAGWLLWRCRDYGAGERYGETGVAQVADGDRRVAVPRYRSGAHRKLGGRRGAAVQEHVEAAGFSVVREFVGHGSGRTCTKSRRCRITGRAVTVRSCAKAW